MIKYAIIKVYTKHNWWDSIKMINREPRAIKLKVLFDVGISDDVTVYEMRRHHGIIKRREFDYLLRTNLGR